VKITLGGTEFRTKGEAAKAISKIIHEASLGAPLDDHFALLMDLLRGHPNADKKIGVGILHFRVTTNKYKSRSLEGVRTDGTTTDFSYRKCLREPTRWEEFVAALRHAVEFDVISARDRAFEGAETIDCPITGKPVTKAEVEVDHLAPDTFEALAEEFAAKETIDRKNPPITESEDGDIGRFVSDLELCERWKRFHKERARLRVISIEAHRKTMPAGMANDTEE
jgi:hypothetical protein